MLSLHFYIVMGKKQKILNYKTVLYFNKSVTINQFKQWYKGIHRMPEYTSI